MTEPANQPQQNPIQPNLWQKFLLFCGQRTPTAYLARRYRCLQAQDPLSDSPELMSAEEYQALLKQKPSPDSVKGQRFLDQLQKKITVNDLCVGFGELTDSMAYQQYHINYRHLFKQQTLSQSPQPTAEDYLTLHNVAQQTYLAQLKAFRQVCIEATVDTCWLLDIINHKLLDYTPPQLVSLHEQQPLMQARVSLIAFQDYSVLVKLDVFDDEPILNKLSQHFIKTLPDFKDFLNNNHAMLDSYQEQHFGNSDNEFAELNNELQKERLRDATKQYINARNLILVELQQHSLIHIGYLGNTLKALTEIKSVAVQEKTFKTEKVGDKLGAKVPMKPLAGVHNAEQLLTMLLKKRLLAILPKKR